MLRCVEATPDGLESGGKANTFPGMAFVTSRLSTSQHQMRCARSRGLIRPSTSDKPRGLVMVVSPIDGGCNGSQDDPRWLARRSAFPTCPVTRSQTEREPPYASPSTISARAYESSTSATKKPRGWGDVQSQDEVDDPARRAASPRSTTSDAGGRHPSSS